MDDALARQMLGQGPAGGLAPGARRGGVRLWLAGRLRVRLGQRRLQILQRQFERVDPDAAFRGGPEALPSQPGDLQLQPFDRDLGHEPRRPLSQDHGVGGGEIGGGSGAFGTL